MKSSWKNTKVVHGLIILGFCLLAYLNSFRNVNLLIDDWDSIVNNPGLNQPKYLFYQFFPNLDPSGLVQYYYRPLISVVIAISYWICGFNVPGFHIINWIFLSLACLSVYGLIQKYFENRPVALMTAVFFAIHPFNSYIVNNASAGFAALQLAFLCWAAILFKSFNDHSKNKGYLAASLGLYAAALLFHDNALTFPVFLFALSFAAIKNTSWNRLLFRLTPYFIVSVILYLIKKHYSAVMDHVLSHQAVSLWQYAASVMKLMVWYVEKLFTGADVVFIWAIPTVSTNLIWWGLLFLMVVLLCLVIYFSKAVDPILRFAAGSSFFAVLAVIGACRFEPAHGWIIEPSWLAFASIAFFAAISFLLLKIRAAFSRIVFILFFSVYVGALLFNSWALNDVWATEERYCTFWAKQAPGFTTPLSYLASYYMREGDLVKAELVLKEALKESDQPILLYKLGMIYFERREWSQAQQYFERALVSAPKSQTLHSMIKRTQEHLENNSPGID